jgi:hypothetical protein
MANEQKIITIDQINGNFHGGFPFIANWNFNDGSSPSTLTVSVVNSAGTYSITDGDLSYQNTVSVSLGSFTFNGYLVGYDIEEAAQQTILTLEYIDQSVNLERWSVGLNNRHGQGSGVPVHMILVGREYGPCDDGLDSTKKFNNQSKSKIDPCDPCPNMPANGYLNVCQDDSTNLKILPVYYTFNELLDKISQCGLNVTKPNDTGGAISNHRAQHTGLLKSVLSTWCSELGLSYYYDPVEQKLVFVNRNTPLSIPDKNELESADKVVSLKYGATRSKTFSRGFIGYLGTQGEIKNYNCEREDAATLYALTLADLLTPDTGAASAEAQFNVKTGGSYETNYTYHPPTNGPKTGQRQLDDMSALYYATALAYYPSQLRLSFLWFYLLGIYDQEAANTWRVAYTSPTGLPSAPNPDGSTPNGSTIYELGNMNIVKVISKQDPATAYIFDCLAKLGSGPYNAVVPDSYLQYVNAQDKADNRDPKNDPSFYFILAQCNADLLNKQEQRDVARAKQFLGRYYYRSFDKMAVAGGSNDNTQLNIDAAGASASYHPRGEYIQQLPIFSFGHTGKSRVGQLVSNLSKDDADNLSSMGNTGTGATKDADKYRSLKSFILLDRGDAAKYYPDEARLEDWHDTWEWYKNIVPQLIGNDGRPDILTKQLDPAQAGADSSLKLFLVRSVKKETYTVKVNTRVPHPSESTTMKTRSKSYEGLDGNSNGVKDHPADGDNNATYGLASANTVQIVLPAGLTIYPPAQSILADGMAEAGFRIFVKSSSKYQKVIPKFQKVAFVDAPSTDNVAQVDYVYKELSSENLEVLADQKECLPKDSEVADYVSKFAKEMAIKNDQVSHKANLKLLGVMPTIYKVSQGLSSVQITVGDNGVYTDYTFEDKIVIPPSEDVIADQIIRQNRIAPTLGSSLQKMTSQQYNDVITANGQAAQFNSNAYQIK